MKSILDKLNNDYETRLKIGLRCLKNGMPDPSGTNFFSLLGKCINEGEELPDEVAVWLGNALVSIGKNEMDANRALLIKRQGRRRDITKEIRDEQIGRAVDALKLSHGLHKEKCRDGSAGAYFLVGEKFNLSASAVEKIYKAVIPRLQELDKIQAQFEEEGSV